MAIWSSSPFRFGSLALTTRIGIAPHTANGVYAERSYGGTQFRKSAEFTFRDADDQSQYGVTDAWRLMAPRWQRMVATGEASGGQAWRENPVTAGERTLYPYPGAKKMSGGGGMVWVNSFKLYDPQAGRSVALGPVYEEPELASLKEGSLNDSYKSIST